MGSAALIKVLLPCDCSRGFQLCRALEEHSRMSWEEGREERINVPATCTEGDLTTSRGAPSGNNLSLFPLQNECLPLDQVKQAPLHL